MTTATRSNNTVTLQIDTDTAAAVAAALQGVGFERHPAIAALLRELTGRKPWEAAGPDGVLSIDEVNAAVEDLDRYVR